MAVLVPPAGGRLEKIADVVFMIPDTHPFYHRLYLYL